MSDGIFTATVVIWAAGFLTVLSLLNRLQEKQGSVPVWFVAWKSTRHLYINLSVAALDIPAGIWAAAEGRHTFWLAGLWANWEVFDL